MADRDDGIEGDDRAWFVYARTAGRISAAPANWKGWAALVACVGATALLGFLAMRLGFRVHPLVGAFALAAVLLTGILLTIRLALAKGRPAG